MAGIRGANTKPEMLVRRGLHALGYRYRLHGKGMPGRPDLVLRKYKAVIFVHGCFWHGHECGIFKWPKTRLEFWQQKISGNRSRDQLVDNRLGEKGWRVLHVWECALRGPGKLGADDVIRRVVNWLNSCERRGEVRGNDSRAV